MGIRMVLILHASESNSIPYGIRIMDQIEKDKFIEIFGVQKIHLNV